MDPTLAYVLFISVLIIVSLSTFIIILLRKVKKLSTPRIGFLGKPLYIALLSISIVSILFISYNVNKSQIDDVAAEKDVRIIINSEIIELKGDYAFVEISFIPYINNDQWGKDDDSFKAYWNIIGKDKYTEVLTNVNKINPQKVTIQLARGQYEINLLIIYKGKAYSTSKSVSF